MKKRLNKEIGSPLTMHDKKLKLSITVVICVVPISLGFGIGLLLETNHIITLQRSGSTLEIIPIIDGNPPIECPEGYRIKPVGYWDKETHYRCLLIQQKEDCLETEIYSRNAMTCLPTNKDLSRFDCGDRYFLDSECHSKYVINESKNALEVDVVFRGYSERQTEECWNVGCNPIGGTPLGDSEIEENIRLALSKFKSNETNGLKISDNCIADFRIIDGEIYLNSVCNRGYPSDENREVNRAWIEVNYDENYKKPDIMELK